MIRTSWGSGIMDGSCNACNRYITHQGTIDHKVEVGTELKIERV